MTEITGLSTVTRPSTPLKGQGHVTVNKPVISRIYIVAHTWQLRSAQILVEGVNPQVSPKNPPISLLPFVSLRSHYYSLPKNSKVSFSRTNQNGEYVKKTRENREDFAKLYQPS